MSANDAQWYAMLLDTKTSCLHAAVNYLECNSMDYAPTAEDVLAVADKFVQWSFDHQRTANNSARMRPLTALPEGMVDEDAITKGVREALERARKGTSEPPNNFPGPIGSK